MKHTDTRGFTLIELLVVVLIIGILASIAVPQYKMAVHKARIRSYLPVLRELTEAEELYYTVNSRYADLSLREELDISFPKACTVNPTQDWRLNCGNHISLVTFGDVSLNKIHSVGLIYCYDGSQPCGDNKNVEIKRLLLNQFEGSQFEGNGGKWACSCVDANDGFCSKLCKTVNKS